VKEDSEVWCRGCLMRKGCEGLCRWMDYVDVGVGFGRCVVLGALGVFGMYSM